MKDFPVFTTQFGAASLTLSQIPYTGRAYITIQDSADPELLLNECCDFCVAAGAETVYASGHDCLAAYPFHTDIVLMSCQREQLGDTDVDLVPMQAQTKEQFRQIYNDAMKDVPNASYMTCSKAEKILAERTGYFAYRGNERLGIGIASGARIYAIVSLVSGCGKDVLLALNRVLSGPYAEVEVATANIPAVRLYEKLGFTQRSVLSRWYKII